MLTFKEGNMTVIGKKLSKIYPKQGIHWQSFHQFVIEGLNKQGRWYSFWNSILFSYKLESPKLYFHHKLSQNCQSNHRVKKEQGFITNWNKKFFIPCQAECIQQSNIKSIQSVASVKIVGNRSTNWKAGISRKLAEYDYNLTSSVRNHNFLLHEQKDTVFLHLLHIDIPQKLMQNKKSF